MLERYSGNRAALYQRVESIVSRHHGTSDSGSTGAAIGLNYIAIELQGALTKSFQIKCRA